jgi:hypothetical protein
VPEIISTAAASASAAPDVAQPAAAEDNVAWIVGARPASVMVGGLLLLLLAAALLAIGQRETTGTIVMLSFCVAPLGVLTLLIGIIRVLAARTRRA